MKYDLQKIFEKRFTSLVWTLGLTVGLFGFLLPAFPDDEVIEH